MSRNSRLFAIIIFSLVVAQAFPTRAQAPSPPQGWLGLGLVLRTAPGSVRFLHVEKVLPGGPGYQAGVHPLDVIAQIDGSAVQFRNDLAVLDYLRGLQPGQRVRFSVDRGTRRLQIVVTVAPFPAEYREAWLHIYSIVREQARRARPE